MVIGNDKQEEDKALLYEEKMKYEEKIRLVNKYIQQINDTIVNDCKQKYGNHEFEQEIESGMYGETFLHCKKCGYEY